MKKSRRMFSLAMLMCLIVGVSTGIRECIGAACALAFVNATLGLEDLEKKMEDQSCERGPGSGTVHHRG